MSLPDPLEIKRVFHRDQSDEHYHAVFDDHLALKLFELDPEWMKAMTWLYEGSGRPRRLDLVGGPYGVQPMPATCARCGHAGEASP